MEWSEVNLDRAVWIIPGSKVKNGKSTTLPLVEPALAILRQRKELSKSKFVFPGRRHGRHIMDLTKPWAALLKKAALEGVRMHDLRRTAGSWMAATGASLPIVGKALGHTTASATAVYARLDLDPVRQAVDKAATAMLTAGKQTIELKSTKAEQEG